MGGEELPLGFEAVSWDVRIGAREQAEVVFGLAWCQIGVLGDIFAWESHVVKSQRVCLWVILHEVACHCLILIAAGHAAHCGCLSKD